MICLNCGKETHNPKFCSRSCSAVVNNKLYVKHKPSHKCKTCGKAISERKRYCSKDCKPKSNKIPIEFLLTKHSTYNRNHLRIRLIKEGLLENICSVCDMLPVWNGKPLTLQLDHINGVKDDNRFENLRLICPNCHSQTVTFSGRNIKK